MGVSQNISGLSRDDPDLTIASEVLTRPESHHGEA